MRGVLTPTRLGGLVAGLLVATVVVLYVVPSSDYILLPNTAQPVAPLVEVQGGHDPSGPGAVYFVDVLERHASLLESLFPWLHTASTIVPANQIVPPGSSDKQAEQADLREMALSQRIAAAVALRQLHYRVVSKPNGVLVQQLLAGTNGAKKLAPADVIVSLDGTPTPTLAKLRAAVTGKKPGDTVMLGVRRGGETLSLAIRLVANPADRSHPLIGFVPGQSAEIQLPLRVSIDAGNIGGPSAGLAFALEVMEELGHDVVHGYRVAATGQINLDGTVGAIGGVEQKTYGARQAKADVFLVPAGDNARDARRYAHGLRIVAVKSFPQALRVLATLPPKP